MSSKKPFGEQIMLPPSSICIVGIDPGAQSGAICVMRLIPYAETLRITREVFSMPQTLPQIRDLLREQRIYESKQMDVMVFLETFKGWSVPPSVRGPALKGYFSRLIKLQKHLGQLEGILVGLKLPYHLVTPQEWQKRLGCLTKGDKHISQRAAEQRFPSMKVTLKNADAILIAHYGCLWQLGEK